MSNVEKFSYKSWKFHKMSMSDRAWNVEDFYAAFNK